MGSKCSTGRGKNQCHEEMMSREKTALPDSGSRAVWDVFSVFVTTTPTAWDFRCVTLGH